MRVIALIDDPGVIRRILEHLGRWAPEPARVRQLPLRIGRSCAQNARVHERGLFRLGVNPLQLAKHVR
jgi:hypothetical protein